MLLWPQCNDTESNHLLSGLSKSLRLVQNGDWERESHPPTLPASFLHIPERCRTRPLPRLQSGQHSRATLPSRKVSCPIRRTYQNWGHCREKAPFGEPFLVEAVNSIQVLLPETHTQAAEARGGGHAAPTRGLGQVGWTSLTMGSGLDREAHDNPPGSGRQCKCSCSLRRPAQPRPPVHSAGFSIHPPSRILSLLPFFFF